MKGIHKKAYLDEKDTEHKQPDIICLFHEAPLLKTYKKL